MRIVQEALQNVVTHRGAATVGLSGYGERLELCISDRGAGFDPAVVRKKDGLGLVSMRERLRPIGGRLVVQPAPSHGRDRAGHPRVPSARVRRPAGIRVAESREWLGRRSSRRARRRAHLMLI